MHRKRGAARRAQVVAPPGEAKQSKSDTEKSSAAAGVALGVAMADRGAR